MGTSARKERLNILQRNYIGGIKVSKKMKVICSVLVVLSIVVGVMVLYNGQISAANVTATASEDGKNIVSVTGEGIVRLAPEIAFITLGVETSDKDVSAAQSRNRSAMNAIIAELNRLGIKDENIQTQNYQVYPDYRWENNKNVLVGYKVTNLVRVKTLDIDSIGKILDAVTAKGANIVQQIQFTVADEKQAYHQALQIALKDAEDKAKTMVGYFGITKLSPISITEGGQSITYPPMGVIREVAADSATPISPGELEVRAHVSVSFQY